MTRRDICGIISRYADVAQSVEQLIRNQQVAGSSPAISSKNPECGSVQDFYLSSLTSSLSLNLHSGFLEK